MIIFFIVLGIIILSIVALALYSSYSRRPKFFRGNLKCLETCLFDELVNKLDAPVKQLIPKQLSYLNTGVRLYFPKSYSLELYGDNDNPLPNEILFERKDEFKLATINFISKGAKFKAEFDTYSGRIWGLTVRPSPKKLLGKPVTEFIKFKLNNDPTEKLDLKIIQEYYSETEVFNGLLGELLKKYNIIKISKPLPQKQKELFIKLSNTKFPSDFLSLCDQTNGFTIDGIRIAGLGQMVSVSLDDDNYLMIAERDIGCLSIKESRRITKFKFHSYEDETNSKDLGASFIEALDNFMKIQ